MICRAVLGLLLAAMAVPGGARAEDENQAKLLTLRARLLEEELALAKLPNAYFLLDLKEKRLELKAGGTGMRSWTFNEVRAWGAPGEVKTLTLIMKDTLKPPQRIEIKPGGGEEKPSPEAAKGEAKKTAAGTPAQAGAAAFELEALELKDMPTAFQMVFDGDLRVSVRATGQSLGSTVGRLWSEARWSIGRPLEADYAQAMKRSFRVLELTLREERDVQALYWALFDGIKGLIWYNPSK